MATCKNNQTSDSLASWIVTIVFLVTPLWPIGLILLLRKLMGSSSKNRRGSSHPYDVGQGGTAPGTQGMGDWQRQATPGGRTATGGGSTSSSAYYATAPRDAKTQAPRGRAAQPTRRSTPAGVNLERGKGLTIAGAIIAIVFAIGLLGFPVVAMQEGFLFSLAMMSPVIGFFFGGLAMVWGGTQRTKKSRRFRKYLALIGKRESISITTLAQAMPTSVHKACEDLQEMLDRGVLAAGYLDMSNGRLVLSDEGLWERPAAPTVEPQPEPAAEDELDMTDADGVLSEIRAVNDAIADPEMSYKIDRIGTIIGKIFAYQKQNPGKESQLRSFLSYYLPTTLKILHAYAQMESQGVAGEHIGAAKQRIEGMMDKVVEGFEKQLDRLFQNNAMDITTDVEVLERMLEKDGLSSGEGLTLGG